MSFKSQWQTAFVPLQRCHSSALRPLSASTSAPSPPPVSLLFTKTLVALSSFSSPLLSSALARIHCVCTYYICGTPSFTSSARETRLLHSLALFTQTKSFSVSRTKPAKSLWLFHVLSAHSSPLSPGHWPGLWIQCAWGNRGRLKECASINLIMT